MSLAIAHVLSSLHTGGAERVALSLLDRLARRGHRVTLVSLEEPPDGALGAEVRDLGVALVPVPKRPGGFDTSLSGRLFSTFVAHRFDVVHTHNPLPLIYAAIPARLAGARVVHSKHGPHPDAPQRLWLRRAGAASVHAFCPVSHATADFARSIHEVRERKIHVVENGVDLDRFRPDPAARARTREALGIPSDALVVGTVGRMEPVKNHGLLVRALAPWLGPGDGARPARHLLIVGHGSEAERTRALAADLGVAAHVTFAGNQRDVPAFVAAFDVFALSSDSEGLPLVLAEAMGVELPVVATSVGGVPKVVVEGETGHLVPPNSEAALRAAIERVAGDPAHARALGVRGREVAVARYGLDRMVAAYEALYRAGGSAPRSR